MDALHGSPANEVGSCLEMSCRSCLQCCGGCSKLEHVKPHETLQVYAITSSLPRSLISDRIGSRNIWIVVQVQVPRFRGSERSMFLNL